MKRKVTPHKGGRDARLEIRINATLKARLQAIARAEGVSMADLIELWITQKGSDAK